MAATSITIESVSNDGSHSYGNHNHESTPSMSTINASSYQSQQPSSSSSFHDIPSPPPYSSIPGTVPLGRRGPPPTYDDVVNTDAPPPSYNSLFGQVREARKSSNGLLDFVRKLIILLLGTLACTMIIGFTLVIPFSMIVMGSLYFNQCRAENIPLLLLIGGIVWTAKNLLNCCAQFRILSNQPESEENTMRKKRHESLLNCFLFAWFITGCVIVYRTTPDFDDSSSRNYCHRTVYQYSFWLITSIFIMFGVFMSCLCCLAVSSLLVTTEEEE